MLRFRSPYSLLISLSICLAVILLAGTATIPFTDQVAAKDDSTKPTLPTPSLTAEINNNAVNLNWTPVEGATHYKLYVSAGSTNTWQQIGGDNLTATSFTHTDVTDGKSYKYSVIAVNASTSSDPSSYASVTMGHRLPAPTLSAHVVTNGIELTWTPVKDAINYRLIVWDDVSQADKWETVSGKRLNGSSYTHTDLTVGATYYYAIRAFGEKGGRSPWAEQISLKVMPPATETPLPPATDTPVPAATETPLPPPTETPTSTATETPLPPAAAAPASTATQTPTPTATETPTVALTPVVPGPVLVPESGYCIITQKLTTGGMRLHPTSRETHKAYFGSDPELVTVSGIHFAAQHAGGDIIIHIYFTVLDSEGKERLIVEAWHGCEYAWSVLQND